MSVSSIDSLSDNPPNLYGDSFAEKPNGAKEGHFLLNPDGTIQYPDTAAAMLGRQGQSLAGRHLLNILDFAIETEDPDGETIHWDLLTSSALETRVPVPAKQGDTGFIRNRLYPFHRIVWGVFRIDHQSTCLGGNVGGESTLNPGSGCRGGPALIEGSSFGLFDLNFGSE